MGYLRFTGAFQAGGLGHQWHAVSAAAIVVQKSSLARGAVAAVPASPGGMEHHS